MTILAFESSCDETSVAVVRGGAVVTNVVASQVSLHTEYGGVVPELAARQHLANIRYVTQEALAQAELKPTEIDGVAATRGPGLPPALMIGFRAGQGFAFALEKPFWGLHHHEAHLYSPWIEIEKGEPYPRANWDGFEPNVSLIVSGGHTLLVDVAGCLQHRILGGTIDDAAGECFDKVAKMIGLPYPGGPELDRLASEGNPKAYEFPRPLLKDPSDDFSFSGLKTSVRYFIEKRPEVLDGVASIRDLCASVQAAIVEVLVTKTVRAADRLGYRMVTASGGVTCNRGLRSALADACEARQLSLRLANPSFCTDNAGMVGILAERYAMSDRMEPVGDEDIRAGWALRSLDAEAV